MTQGGARFRGTSQGTEGAGSLSATHKCEGWQATDRAVGSVVYQQRCTCWYHSMTLPPQSWARCTAAAPPMGNITARPWEDSSRGAQADIQEQTKVTRCKVETGW